MERNDQDSITELLQQFKLVHFGNTTKECQTHSSFNNILTIPTEFLSVKSFSSSITRAQHTLKFMHYQTFVDNYQYSFFPRTVPQWISLEICNINVI